MQPFFSVMPTNNFLLRGKWNGQAAELAWEYEGLSPGASFDIEMSADVNHFSTVGNLAYSASKYYSFRHITTQKNVYYRIRSNEAGGVKRYSNTIKLSGSSAVTGMMIADIYPNPVQHELKLAFSILQKGRAIYSITWLNGQVVWRKEEELNAVGAYLRNWDVSGIRSGTYIFSIKTTEGIITRKFVKQ